MTNATTTRPNASRMALARRRFQDRLCVVVGTGRSGLAAGRLLAALGARVRFVDADESKTPAVLGDLAGTAELLTGPHGPEQFLDAALTVLSPGVPIRKLADVLGAMPPERIVAETELASWFTDGPSIAVTGSNGKTTTVNLISRILEKAGLTVFTGGNIGTPLSEYVLENKPVDVLVLELSSFQLQTCRTYRPNAAAMLNFSANHLDWHETMEEYLQAKLSLFARQTPADLAVLPASMREELQGQLRTGAEIVWYEPSSEYRCPGLLGAHNQANMEAAFQLVRRFGVDRAVMDAALAEFAPPSHRLQKVGEKNGVLFVDDSKATTLEASLAAVRSFEGPVRLLLGGVFKGGDVEAFAGSMNGRLVEVGLFGASREVFEPALSRKAPTHWHENLEQAVAALHRSAKPGDVILLSPATSSFDQYSGYAARGDDFQRIFRELA